MSRHEHYSDLQVVPQEQDPKYLVSTLHEPQEIDSLQGAYPSKYATEGQAYNGYNDSQQAQQPQKKRKICGLPVKTFWIVAGIAIVIIIAAAVGGGVGGSLSSKDIKKIADDSAASSTASSESTTKSAVVSTASVTTTSGTPTTSQVIISTSTTQSPEYTLLSDCPSSNWTIYTPSGTSQMFRKICQDAFLNENGINAVVNTPTSDLDDCIGLCAAYNVQNATEILSGTSDVCNAVCWRATIEGNDWPGQCFGYSTRNNTGNFILTSDTRCNGAALINQ